MITKLSGFVNLPNVKKTVELDGIWDNLVCCHIEDEPYVFDLANNVLRSTKHWFSYRVTTLHTIDGEELFANTSPFISVSEEESVRFYAPDHRIPRKFTDGKTDQLYLDARYFSREGYIYGIPAEVGQFTSVVRTLMESKVGLDDVSKGLIASKIKPSWKWQRNYATQGIIVTQLENAEDITDQEVRLAIVLERVFLGYWVNDQRREGHEG